MLELSECVGISRCGQSEILRDVVHEIFLLISY